MNTILDTILTESQQAFVAQLDTAFKESNRDFARAYYLFSTAKLSDTYNSQEIYERYPILTDEKTFQELKKLYDAHPDNESIIRLFTNVLGSYVGNQLAEKSDAFQNLKNQLRVDVSELGLMDDDGKVIESLLYEDVSEWLKKLDDKAKRQKLYDTMAKAHKESLAPAFIELFEAENTFLATLGYPDVVEFYSKTSGHNLMALADTGEKLVAETHDLYTERMGAFYTERTGHPFSEATRADISYVLNGKSPNMATIDARFPESNMVPLATKTFDGLGLNFSGIATSVNFPDLKTYESVVVDVTDSEEGGKTPRILLDITKREGKRSRAFVYPAVVPSEIYLSVKPEGGLDDYSAFFHESGHAQHFAYEDASLNFIWSLMGNNTTTEAYAYLFQNLFLNRHWLQTMAGLNEDEAKQVVQRGALNDLYMLRRYASKMRFEAKLYTGVNDPEYTYDDKGALYASLLTQGGGFVYDADGWSRDVDAGFYVADYFTAWTLEAQLREYLCTQFGTPDVHGEDWYQNPEAGAFLKGLWKDGNLPQRELCSRIGFNDPNDIAPLVKWMNYNLN